MVLHTLTTIVVNNTFATIVDWLIVLSSFILIALAFVIATLVGVMAGMIRGGCGNGRRNRKESRQIHPGPCPPGPHRHYGPLKVIEKE